MSTEAIIGIIIGLSGIIVALITGIPQLKKQIDESKEMKFKNMLEEWERHSLSLRNSLKKEIAIEEGLTGLPYIVYFKNWMHKKGNYLINLDDIILIPDDSCYNYSKIKKYIKRKIILPRKNHSIVENLNTVPNGSERWDNTTYGVSKIEALENTIKIHIKKGTYFEFIDTCYAYGFEAAYIHNNARKKYFLREKFPISDFNERFAAIGISTIVIITNVVNDKGDKCGYFFIQERSQNVSDCKGMSIACPAGTFQPSIENKAMKLAEALSNEGLKHNIIREFYEELFDKEEFTELTDHIQITNSDAWKAFGNKMYFLGCGINPVNVYLEILSCAVIDIEEPISKKLFNFSDTTMTITKEAIEKNILQNKEGKIKLKPFNKDELKFYITYRESAPALSQTCKVILDDYEKIIKELGIEENK